MESICKISGAKFIISEKEIVLCQKMNVPLPTLSPRERLRQLMTNRNEWKLYKRKCDATSENIISAYHPDSPFKIYQNEFWWGDKWNALDFGREYNFNRSFFEQYAELQKDVPREGTSVFRSENCDYNSHIRESRNCYLNSLVYRCEDIAFSYWMSNSRDCLDCYLTRDSELCYWCVDVTESYYCVALQECLNCSDCHFSFQLRGCQNCLFCTNLNNKNYYIFNKAHTKEQFEAEKKKIFSGSYQKFTESLKKFTEIKLRAVHRYVHNINTNNCTGDHMANDKNCEHCFESYNSEDCLHSISTDQSRDVHSCYSAGWPGCDQVYNSVVTRGSTNIAYCIYTFFSSNLRYCDSTNDCHDCFGSIGLQHKKYCILNKQYSGTEYELLSRRIIERMKETGEWGQFFPPFLNVFAYNETAANDYFPLDQDEIMKLGYRLRAINQQDYRPATIIEIPDNIKNSAEINKEILACENCGKNYKIDLSELHFYQKLNLPVPHNCPPCRHEQRRKMRNSLEIFPRQCDKCRILIESSYQTGRPEKVYCEKCYLDAII